MNPDPHTRPKMPGYTNQLYHLLAAHPEISLAYVDQDADPPRLHVHSLPTAALRNLALPADLANLPVEYHDGPQITDLRAPANTIAVDNPHQVCQNEPVQLATQVQPAGANWVATAGAPVSWTMPDGHRFWGLLSNRHVLCLTKPKHGDPIHQPTTAQRRLARLADWSALLRTHPNHTDAAIADTFLDGFHTTAFSIIGIGHLNPDPTRATKGLLVKKAGRTTRVTNGRCTQTLATVRVGYGDRTLLFIDQDIFEGDPAPFSAAGDSGSLIVTRATNSPTSLLFAGGGGLTVGNPIHFVVDEFELRFSP